MNFHKTIGKYGLALAILHVLAGCANGDIILRNALFGLGESWCQSSSSCATGGIRDPLAAHPPWENPHARPNDAPFRLPPLK